MKSRWHKYRLLFKTQSSFFLFNLLNKAVIRISRQMAEEAELSGEFRPFDDDSFNKELARLSFVIPANMADSELVFRWFNALCGTSKTFEWLLLLTNQCNFSCRYCFQEADASFRGTTDACWPQIIRWLNSAIQQREPRHVRVAFFGGEPLCQLGLLEEISSVLRKTCAAVGAAWRFDIVTNGYYFDGTTCDRLLELGLKRVQITLDGPPVTHNERRPANIDNKPTFDEVLQSIEVASRHAGLQCVVRTNIDRHNVAYYTEVLDILCAKNLSGRVWLSIVPTKPARQATWPWNEFCVSRSDAPSLVAPCIGEAVRRGFRVFTRSLEAGPCMSLARGTLVVEPNGNLSKCHHLANDPQFVLGNIRRGAPFSVLDATLPSPWPECVECPYVPLCLGGCRYEALRYTNRPNGKCCGIKHYMQAVIPAYLSQFISGECQHDKDELIGAFMRAGHHGV